MLQDSRGLGGRDAELSVSFGALGSRMSFGWVSRKDVSRSDIS